MKSNPPLFYKIKAEIDAYIRKPVRKKIMWLEAQIEFFYKAMTEKAKGLYYIGMQYGHGHRLQLTRYKRHFYKHNYFIFLS